MLYIFDKLDFVIYGIGFALLLVWMIFYIIGLKHAGLFDPIEEKSYPLKEIYFVGYAFMEAIGYQYKSKHDRKLRKDISVLHGEKYADYYLRVIHSQKVTFAFTLTVLAFPMYGLADSVAALFVMLMFAAVAYYYFGTVTEKEITKRSEEMLSDFSDLVSKLALLTNAGMIIREAWEEVAYTGDSTLYKEMQTTVDEMRNGVSEVDALFNFGTL